MTQNKTDIELENEIEVFLKEYPTIKNKRGRPKQEVVSSNGSGIFNLRAFLRLGLSLSDLETNHATNTYFVSEGVITSLYDCAKSEGYNGIFNQYMQTFRLILKEKIELKKSRMNSNAPEQ